MTNLRKLAKGQPCMVRIPNCCTGGGETTVLAHIRISGISGMGLKAPDILGAYACHACHQCADGQVKSSYSAAERRLMLLEGVMRTQAYLIKAGFLKW